MTTTHQGPFLAGVVEGFYGQPWTQAQRLSLYGQMASWGLNTYFYAPKDDLKHRAIWRECYDRDELAALRTLVEASHHHGLRFIYGLSPGLDIRFAEAADRDHIKQRFEQLLSIGCTDFALLFDDLPGELSAADRQQFGSPAEAQCAVTNEVVGWLRASHSKGRFLFCPTAYCERMVSWQLGGPDYLETVGHELDPSVDVLWTGPEIISREIPLESIQTLTQRLGRPPVIWDNLHANDYDGHRMFCGPYSGRSPKLKSAVRGILSNPNNEFPVNFIPLRTLGRFVQTSVDWDPRAAFLESVEAWHDEFLTVGHPLPLEDLRLLADLYYLPHSDGPEAEELGDLIGELIRQPTSLPDERYRRFLDFNRRVQSLFERLTELRDRKLFYAWSRRAWELKEELQLIESYLASRQSDSARPRTFLSENHLPGTYRGGFVARLQRLLAVDSRGGCRPGEAFIRDYCQGDDADTYQVCLETGDHGQDGTRFYREDPDALGRLYVGPYLVFEPDLALILEDAQGVCGYALGALDSHTFYDRYEQEWRPQLCRDFPEPTGEPSSWSRVQEVYHVYHHPDAFCPDPYADYPSHVHIDLLPRIQGRGWGRRLMEALLQRLTNAGSSGVHLGLSAINPRAYVFYQKLGFNELARVGEGSNGTIYMGKRLR